MKYGLEEQTLQTIFLIFGKYPEDLTLHQLCILRILTAISV